MANMNVEEKVWQLPIDITESGVETKILKTADTYVDKDIKVTVNTPDAEFEVKTAGSVTAEVSTTDTTYTSTTETPYAIEIAADATAGAVTTGVKTAGFAAATDTVTVAEATAEQNKKTIYVKEGHLTGSGEASATSTSVKMTKGGTSDFQITATAAGGAEVDVAGWLPVGASADASGDTTYAIQAATLANTEGSGTYTEKDAPVLTSGGYLYINEGYIKDTKISLATLIPDNANITDENANLVYNTVKAYDKDGALIVGTMGDAELSAITADDAAATVGSVSVTADEAAFKVTGSADITGTTSVGVATRGLAETSLSQTGTISGTAKVDATLAKIGVGVELPETESYGTPEIISAGGVGEEITTEAPSGPYVAVKTTEIEIPTTVSPKVTSAGYGTEDAFSGTDATVKATAKATENYYIPIKAATPSINTSSATVVNAAATVETSVEGSAGFEGSIAAGVLSTAPTTGEYIVINSDANSTTAGSVTGSVDISVTKGYLEEPISKTETISSDAVEVEVTAAAPKYIKVYDGSIVEG